VGPGEERNLREEAGTGPGEVAVDIVAPHFPRSDDWAAATGTRVTALKGVLEKMGRGLPIYLNEERRTDDRVALEPAAYQEAVAKARQAGVAAWLFHTAAGFSLKQKPFLDALAANERAALSALK
jgi:hypothetical protein